MNWYYAEQGKQTGPVDEAQLARMSAEGKIQEETLVWHEGMKNWKPFRDVEFHSPPPLPPPPRQPTAPAIAPTDAVCVECKNVFPRENMIHVGNSWVCAACKPVFTQKLAEGVQNSSKTTSTAMRTSPAMDTSRPISVKLAVGCLVFSDVRSLIHRLVRANSERVILPSIFAAVILLFLVLMIYRRKNWARWTFACFLLVWLMELAINPLITRLTITAYLDLGAQVLLWLAAAFLLFGSRADQWFKTKKGPA